MFHCELIVLILFLTKMQQYYYCCITSHMSPISTHFAGLWQMIHSPGESEGSSLPFSIRPPFSKPHAGSVQARVQRLPSANPTSTYPVSLQCVQGFSPFRQKTHFAFMLSMLLFLLAPFDKSVSVRWTQQHRHPFCRIGFNPMSFTKHFKFHM